MMISLPMLPTDQPADLASGAAGRYDSHIRTAARRLAAAGMANALVRIGWEFDLPASRWSARHDPVSYVAYYRRIVSTRP